MHTSLSLVHLLPILTNVDVWLKAQERKQEHYASHMAAMEDDDSTRMDYEYHKQYYLDFDMVAERELRDYGNSEKRKCRARANYPEKPNYQEKDNGCEKYDYRMDFE